MSYNKTLENVKLSEPRKCSAFKYLKVKIVSYLLSDHASNHAHHTTKYYGLSKTNRDRLFWIMYMDINAIHFRD